MGTIDIKLKNYDELTFEITKLNTDKYLLEQKVDKYKEIIDKAIEYIEKYCIDGVENEYNTPQTVFEEEGNEKNNARIELLNILKGDNK